MPGADRCWHTAGMTTKKANTQAPKNVPLSDVDIMNVEIKSYTLGSMNQMKDMVGILDRVAEENPDNQKVVMRIYELLDESAQATLQFVQEKGRELETRFAEGKKSTKSTTVFADYVDRS